jgi:DNA-binding transcriptional ArsR family regulator
MSGAVELLHEPERVRLALSPLRRQLLERLREPASATHLAAALGTSRQRLNYHLRALEQAGLIELVELRQRRGCIERILRATATAFVVDPSVVAADNSTADVAQDRFAAEHLIDTAAGVVRNVARMQSNAQREDKRLLTFTIEADVRFADPGDVERFADRLADLVERAVSDFDSPSGGGRYRVVVGGHPAPGTPSDDATSSTRPHTAIIANKDKEP